MAEPATAGRDGPPDLWDPVVRIAHWGIAAAVLLNGLVTEDGGIAHVWIGWAMLGLLALRLTWGFVGPDEARFTAFPPSLGGALGHLRALVRGERPRYRSHNPAGALVAYVFWAMLALVSATGIAMTGTGPVGSLERNTAIETQDWSTLDLSEGGEWDEWLEEVHELAANLILLLAVLHVAGVAVESRLMGHNLLAPMLAGSRSARGSPDPGTPPRMPR